MEKGKYDDILHRERPASLRHPPMPIRDRAAQFSPFAALNGYEAAVRESARLTEKKAELDEETTRQLNEKLRLLKEAEEMRPEAEFLYFREDMRKTGGAYRRVCGCVKHVDAHSRTVLLEDGTVIPMGDIAEISSALFDAAEFDGST